MKRVSPFLSVVLTPFLAVSLLGAETPVIPAGASAVTADSQNLQLRVIESDGPQAAAGSRAIKGFTVQVTGPTGSPVPDAAIAFRLPDSGPTGVFVDGSHSTVVYTDISGRAHVSGIAWSAIPGAVEMRISAAKGTAHTGILFDQILTAPEAVASSTPPATRPLSPGALPSVSVQPATPQSAAKVSPQQNTTAPNTDPTVSVTRPSPDTTAHSGSKAKWIILIAVAAAAGVGVAVAGKGKSNSASTPASTTSIGSPTISIGQP